MNYTVENGVVAIKRESNTKADYHADQREQAVAAAQTIIKSGVLGDYVVNKFNVTVSAHGNPDHEKTSGWANDYITISISQN